MVFRFRLIVAGLLTAALMAGGCATSPRKHEPSVKAVRNISNLAAEASTAEREKNPQRALAIYKVITKNFPTGSESAIAWYRLGQNYLNLRDYRQAVESFEKVVEYFPKEDFHFDSYVKMGISLVYLKRHNKAEETLKEALKKARNPQERSTIFYHLGENRYLQSDFSAAVDWLVECRNTAGLFRNQAERRIRLIFRSDLSEKELWNITTRYKKRFPADLAYIELVQFYERNADTRSLARLQRKQAMEFPEHKFPAEMAEPETGPVEVNAIGCLLPLSGESAEKGAEALTGIQLAFSMSRRIVERHQIRLLIRDSFDDSGAVSDAIREFGKDESVISVIGPLSEKALNAALKVVDNYGLPLMTSSDTSRDEEAISMNIFPIGITERRQGKILAELAVEGMRSYRIAVLYPANSYGQELMESFIQTAESLGAIIVAAESYEPEATDFGEQIRNMGGMRDLNLRDIIFDLAEANPESTPDEINEILEMEYQEELTIPYIVKYRELPLTRENFSVGLKLNYEAIFIPGSYEAAGLILPELAFYNISKVNVLGSDLYASPALITIGGKYAEGVVFPVEFVPDSERFAVRRFVKNYESAFGSKPSLVTARAYDATNILLSIIESGADTKTRIINSLNSLEPYLGVSGEFGVGLDNRMVKTPFFMTVKEGKIVEFDLSEMENTLSEEPGF